MNEGMPQWLWKRPMTHWVWAVMWLLLIGGPLSLLPQCVLIGSAYPERRTWGRWSAVFATMVYIGLAWWVSWDGAVILAILAALFGSLALYGFWRERKMTAQHGDDKRRA